MPPSPTYQPATFIGALMTILALVGQAIAQVTANGGTPSTASYVVAVAVALLPTVAGYLISKKVITKAWVTDVIKAAQTVEQVAQQVADEVGVPRSQRPNA